jgi:hypothetical protein
MVDPLLVQLADAVERGDGALSVSLIVGGRVVAGILVSEQTWVRLFATQLAGLSVDEADEITMLTLANASPDELGGEADAAEDRHLHLVAPVPGGGYTIRWRLRLAAVDGWHLVSPAEDGAA